MSRAFWKRNKPDHDDVVWNDLRDPAAKLGIRGWVLTYREYHGSWHVMWNPKIFSNSSDQLISKNVPEEQLRNDLKLNYLLTRGETNNVR